MRVLGIMAALVAALFLAGCQVPQTARITELKHSTEDGGLRPVRILLMPADVQLFELSAAGLPEPRADWTDSAQKYFSEAIASERDERHLDTIDLDPAAFAPRGVDPDAVNQLSKLHGLVGAAVSAHRIPALALPSKQGKLDWSLGPSVKTLASLCGCDYALFTYIRDSYSSPGRTAVIVVGLLLGVGVPGGSQVGYASPVDLESGDIVWFNQLIRATGDLRNAAAARATVKTLLTGLPK